jgi:hypothetical protein
VSHVNIPKTWQAEAGRWRILGHLELYGEALSKIYKQVLYLKIKTNNLTKNGQEFQYTFLQMASRYIKKFSASPRIRNLQIKTTMR